MAFSELVSTGTIKPGIVTVWLFNSGLTHYENKKYNEAIELLEAAVKLEPEVAVYHHILAKSYGREAEQTGWFRAMSLAKKTLAHLQLANELDGDNLDILDDLKEYYREAPGFLGGDDKKADEIEKFLKNQGNEEQKPAKLE